MGFQSFSDRDYSLAGPALFRRVYRKELLNLVAVRHIQCWRGPQNPGQIAVWIQAILLGGLDQAEVNGTSLRTAGCIGEQEVLPGHYKGFIRSLCTLCEYSDKQPKGLCAQWLNSEGTVFSVSRQTVQKSRP